MYETIKSLYYFIININFGIKTDKSSYLTFISSYILFDGPIFLSMFRYENIASKTWNQSWHFEYMIVNRISFIENNSLYMIWINLLPCLFSVNSSDYLDDLKINERRSYSFSVYILTIIILLAEPTTWFAWN